MANSSPIETISLMAKANHAVKTLQNELLDAKAENKNLKKSVEGKALQLRELQQAMDTQGLRLQALDSRLAQGQDALRAACVEVQSKEMEIRGLQHALANRDQQIREQTALSITIQELKEQALNREAAFKQQAQASAATSDDLRGELQRSQLTLAEERSRWDAARRAHAEAQAEFDSRIKQKDAELSFVRQQSTAAAAEGASTARNLAEQLANERSAREKERSRLFQECQRRLEDAEMWIDRAAAVAEERKKEAAAAVEEATANMQRLESEWARRLDDAVHDARREGRQRLHSAQERAVLATEKHSEEKLLESVQSCRGAMQADYERLRGQVERCLEALVERVVRGQTKIEKRQSKLLKHVRYLALAGAAPPRLLPSHSAFCAPHAHCCASGGWGYEMSD